MRNLFWLSLCGSLFIANLSADSIQYTITDLDNGEYEYNYFLTGEYDANQVVEIDLCSAASNCSDWALYNNPVDMSNAGEDWSTGAFEADPAGNLPGLWLAESLVDDASLTGSFSVYFQYTGSGTPGPQPFSVWELSDGNPTNLITSGTTTLMQTDPTPEPASWALSGLALLVIAAFKLIRRKARPAAL